MTALHKMLFSPPPSPPFSRQDGTTGPTNGGPLASIKNMLPPQIRKSLDASLGDKAPRLSDAEKGTLSRVDEVDGENATEAYTEKKKNSRPLLSYIISPRIQAIAARYNIPRPLIRLLGFAALFIFCYYVLGHEVKSDVATVKATDPATYRPAYMDAYVPPQAREDGNRRRKAVPAPNPRTKRPNRHPLPPAYEILGLQAFVLESSYNRLPVTYDVKSPLDAITVLGHAGARRLGQPDSKEEAAWHVRLARQFENEVVVWYAGRIPPHQALEGISNRHGQGRRPTLIAVSKREDEEVIRGIFLRMGHDLEKAPLIVMGSKTIDASDEVMAAMRESGELQERLEEIGW